MGQGEALAALIQQADSKRFGRGGWGGGRFFSERVSFNIPPGGCAAVQAPQDHRDPARACQTLRNLSLLQHYIVFWGRLNMKQNLNM